MLYERREPMLLPMQLFEYKDCSTRVASNADVPLCLCCLLGAVVYLRILNEAELSSTIQSIASLLTLVGYEYTDYSLP